MDSSSNFSRSETHDLEVAAIENILGVNSNVHWKWVFEIIELHSANFLIVLEIAHLSFEI